jgi:hypothetical protein
MNRTLVELVCAMLRASDLPEFLRGHAVEHAGYIRNRSYMKFLENETPYQGWTGRRPDVSHLHEFGASIWVLLQGQKEDRKMLPKSKWCAYVGFDNGPKALKYYNAETRKVLTARNFRHLTAPANPAPLKEIEIQPNMPLEGEPGGESRGESTLVPANNG